MLSRLLDGERIGISDGWLRGRFGIAAVFYEHGGQRQTGGGSLVAIGVLKVLVVERVDRRVYR